MNNNIFAPPSEQAQREGPISKAAAGSGSGSLLWVHEPHVYGRDPLLLPDCCALCGQEADEAEGGARRDKTQAWFPPFLILTVFLGVLILLIMLLVFQKRARVAYSLCPRHAADYRKLRIINLVTWLAFVASIVIAIAAQVAWVALAIPVLLLAGLVTAILARERVRLGGHKQGSFKLVGTGPEVRALISDELASRQARSAAS